ncbi:hypothetical protein H8F24_12440 [Synechococcus sp. CBW1002]|uniref:hypothetical protein n=1 Tax=Synechococcus sp. CBW1002 TaxID=1353134 RepID=UPI0018CD6301|nr:hypothetical protein [Synechococcus sp. CBW1002]QPN58927.1 hypothetical protein H8F24_12440 [Synechococcus sp. CBW1002]
MLLLGAQGHDGLRLQHLDAIAESIDLNLLALQGLLELVQERTKTRAFFLLIENVVFAEAGVFPQQARAPLQNLGGALILDDRDDTAALQLIEILNRLESPQLVIIGAFVPQLLGGDMVLGTNQREVPEVNLAVPVVKLGLLVLTSEHHRPCLTNDR